MPDGEGRYAYGLYQFQDRTWYAVTGLPGHASDYSAATQTRAFLKLFDNGKGKAHWDYPGSSRQCW